MKTPEQIARDRQRIKDWKKAHPERVRQLNAQSLARKPRQHTAEQRAAAVERSRRWAEKHPEKRAAHARATERRYRAKHPERVKKSFRGWVLRSKYGITHEDYDIMLVMQDNRCAICRTDVPGGRGTFHVDHDHVTGKVRELLCHGCNLMLGAGKDDPKVLSAGADYLTRHKPTA